MNILSALLGEHGAFYAQFEYLERVVPAAQTAAQVRDSMAVLAAALGTHAALEDELLFAVLEQRIGAVMGPLPVMRREHEEIERALADLERVSSLSEAQRLADHVLQTARGHFAKEEQVLFPMAEQVLDAAERERLGAEWAARRMVHISDTAYSH